MRKEAYICFPLIWLVVCVVICVSPLRANMVYPLEIFTTEGQYYDSPDLDLYVVAFDVGMEQVGFSFYNESLIYSSIARIYFDDDDGSLSDIASIAGLGTSFSRSAAPKNLPAGKSLAPPFEATEAFSIGGDAPPPKNGINPGEWCTITFDLINGGTFGDVIGGLNSSSLRIGAHVIALPDGSSGSALAVPEPGALMLLGAVGLWILTRKRRFA